MNKNAPEKIYLEKIYPDNGVLPNGLNYNQSSNDIEYTRTDTFVEKACKLLARMIWEITYEDLEGNSTEHYDKMEFIEDFRNYMKGE